MPLIHYACCHYPSQSRLFIFFLNSHVIGAWQIRKVMLWLMRNHQSPSKCRCVCLSPKILFIRLSRPNHGVSNRKDGKQLLQNPLFRVRFYADVVWMPCIKLRRLLCFTRNYLYWWRLNPGSYLSLLFLSESKRPGSSLAKVELRG